MSLLKKIINLLKNINKEKNSSKNKSPHEVYFYGDGQKKLSIVDENKKKTVKK
tara:strand:- start:12 stop:170 length:159 start_codon:yes stop_codon:yes gene_type:complete